MKKTVLAALVLFICVMSGAKEVIRPVAVLERNYPLALGLFIGDPIGLNIRLIDSKGSMYSAVMTFGIGVKFHAQVNYMFSDRKFFEDFKLPDANVVAYYGPGGLLRSTSTEDLIIGAILTGGVEYEMINSPLGIFIEASPAFLLTPSIKFSLFGGVGVRYYF